MKTLAELKREVNTGKLKFEMIYRFGVAIPEKMQGLRQATRASSVAIMLLNNQGQESELRIDTAKLIDYDGETLTVYQAAERDLTEEEKAIKAKEVAYVDEYLKRNPYGEPYWQEVAFYKEHKDFAYLSGWDEHKGKRYTYNGKIFDKSIKGEKILQYKIYREV